MTRGDIDNITTWAVNTAERYGRGIMEVVARFKELESSGASIEQAKKEIEDVYAN